MGEKKTQKGRGRYRCVLFDVYQTLLQQIPVMAERLDRMLTELQVVHTADDVERLIAHCEYEIGSQAHLAGNNMMDDGRFLSHMLAYHCSRLYPHEVHTVTAARMLAETAAAYTLMPGAWHVLTRLKSKDVRLGIVCNGTASLRCVLDEMALTHFWDCIVISDEVGMQKPDPQIILYACKQCGVSPQETLYVGDHPFDVVCAHQAGADAAWMPSNLWFQLANDSPDYLLKNLRDLLNLI